MTTIQVQSRVLRDAMLSYMAAEKQRSVTVRFSEAEYRKLKMAAGNGTMSDYIRARLVKIRTASIPMATIAKVKDAVQASERSLEEIRGLLLRLESDLTHDK